MFSRIRLIEYTHSTMFLRIRLIEYTYSIVFSRICLIEYTLFPRFSLLPGGSRPLVGGPGLPPASGARLRFSHVFPDPS